MAILSRVNCPLLLLVLIGFVGHACAKAADVSAGTPLSALSLDELDERLKVRSISGILPFLPAAFRLVVVR